MTPDLFPHQRDAAFRLATGQPTYLGFDMGLGKTRTFIEAVLMANARRVLVLCPASAVLVWKREIQQWNAGALVVVVRTPRDFVAEASIVPTYFIVTHGLMSQREGPVAQALTLTMKFDMTAIDEAHAFNSGVSLRVKALQRSAIKLGHIVPLSGTPMRNHAGDLYTLLNLCYPKALQTASGARMTRFDFEETFCRVAMKNFGTGRLTRVIEGSKNLDKLKPLIAPFMLRVRKEDVFEDLPAINWGNVPVALDKAMISDADLVKLTDQIDPGNILSNELLERLSRLNRDAHLMTLRRMLGLAKLRGACEYIIDMLDNLPPDRKVLVFAVHADVIRAMTHQLAEYNPAVLTGETSAPEREAAVDKFLMHPGCRVFIGNIQAAGTAITLVGPTCKCSDVVFVESSWTPTDNAQAACRVHRIGQHDGVVARMLSANGTIDDLINGILVRKAHEFTQLFDGETT